MAGLPMPPPKPLVVESSQRHSAVLGDLTVAARLWEVDISLLRLSLRPDSGRKVAAAMTIVPHDDALKHGGIGSLPKIDNAFAASLVLSRGGDLTTKATS